VAKHKLGLGYYELELLRFRATSSASPRRVREVLPRFLLLGEGQSVTPLHQHRSHSDDVRRWLRRIGPYLRIRHTLRQIRRSPILVIADSHYSVLQIALIPVCVFLFFYDRNHLSHILPIKVGLVIYTVVALFNCKEYSKFIYTKVRIICFRNDY
jgi:hypothetical protein